MQRPPLAVACVLLLMLLCDGVSQDVYRGKRAAWRFKRQQRRQQQLALGPGVAAQESDPTAAVTLADAAVTPPDADPAAIATAAAVAAAEEAAAAPLELEASADGAAMESAAAAAVVAAAQPSACLLQYAQTDIRPIRTMWNSSNGFCGETSLQMILMARGIWLGQLQARSLAGCRVSSQADLILYDRSTTSCSIFPFLKDTLGFDQPGSSYWDSKNQSLKYATVGTNNKVWPYSSKTVGYTTPPASSFLQWIKQQVAAGRPVVAAVRLKGFTDSYYDHILPVWGVCAQNATATSALNNATDAFSLSTDFGDEIFRNATDAGIYGRWKECSYALSYGQGGCIPSDIYNYGVAVGHLKDTGNVLVKTQKLTITAWSDSSEPSREPGEPATGSSTSTGSSITASYRLTVSGLVASGNYTTWRMPGLLAGSPRAAPTSYAAMKTRCTSLTDCRSVNFTAPASATVDINHTSLGTFAANSLQYFFTLKRP